MNPTSAKIFRYENDSFYESEVPLTAGCLDDFQNDAFTWIDIERLTSADEIEIIQDFFSLHPTILDDILDVHQLPKFKKFESFFFFSFKILSINTVLEKVEREHVSIIVSNNFLVSIHENPECAIFNQLKAKINDGRIDIEFYTPDYLFYHISNEVIDLYFDIVNHISKKSYALQDKLITREIDNPIMDILDLKKELTDLRKYLYPFRKELSALLKLKPNAIREKTVIYLEDVLDNLNHVLELEEDSKNTISSLLDLNTTNNSNKTNEIINTLTLISSIFIPLSFLTGLYGMNFIWMPELTWKWSYPTLLIIMALLSAAMFTYMKRKKWF